MRRHGGICTTKADTLAGDAHAPWYQPPVADTQAGDEHARWHSYKGGVAGGLPPHKGGPERPDRPKGLRKVYFQFAREWTDELT